MYFAGLIADDARMTRRDLPPWAKTVDSSLLYTDALVLNSEACWTMQEFRRCIRFDGLATSNTPEQHYFVWYTRT